MSHKKTHHNKQFKLDAVNYRNEHPDLTQVECAKNLGIGVSTLARWEAQFRDNDGDIPTIGSGCYEYVKYTEGDGKMSSIHSDWAKAVRWLKSSHSM